MYQAEISTRADAEKLATNILEENNITETPVNVVNIAKNYDIKIYYLLEKKREKNRINKLGLVRIKDGNPEIIIKPGLTPEAQQFAIAHMLGHIFMGHVHSAPKQRIKESPDMFYIVRSAEEEDLANVFAMALLMPESQIQYYLAQPISFAREYVEASEEDYEIAEKCCVPANIALVWRLYLTRIKGLKY